jgi:hypothetical protein
MSDMDIIKQLDYHKKFLHEKDTQEKLREFVTNKNKSLDERFRVWSEHCDKKEERWILHKGEYGIIGNMVDACWPIDYDRYRIYTWEYFLDYIENINDYDDLPSTINKPSFDEFKEMLIETNFGSFTMDW